MKDEYIIVNKTAIQQRIEELKKRQEDFLSNHPDDITNYDSLQKEIDILEQILSQSTPLIPEIEKAFDAAKEGWNQQKEHSHGFYVGKFKGNKQDYISNLKLEI